MKTKSSIILLSLLFIAGCSRPAFIDVLSELGVTPSTVDSISVQSTEENPDDRKTVVLNSSQQKVLWAALRSAGRPEDYIIETDAIIYLRVKGPDSEPFLLYIDHYGVIHIPSLKGGSAFYYSMDAYNIVNDALGGRLHSPHNP